MSLVKQQLSVYVKIIVITLFVVMLGSVIAPTFAQQFQEPDYTIRGAKVLGFEIDVETASLTILLDTRARGEIIIILPRNLIDARDGFDDIDFEIFVSSTKALTSYDEIKTSFDRTITNPIKKLNKEIVKHKEEKAEKEVVEIDIRSENSAYITIGKWVIYVDNSTGEKFIDSWEE